MHNTSIIIYICENINKYTNKHWFYQYVWNLGLPQQVYKNKPLFSASLRIVNRRPIQNYYISSNKVSLNNSPPMTSDTCSIYKVSMNQELYFQYLEYEKDLPELKEFTLCMWMKFHNHSADHPLFSYAGKFLLIYNRISLILAVKWILRWG